MLVKCLALGLAHREIRKIGYKMKNIAKVGWKLKEQFQCVLDFPKG